MDPLAKVRGFRHVSDSLPGMSGEIALARAPRTRYIVAIDGVVGHVEATDHEAAAQDAAETYWLALEIRERVIVEVVEPLSAGGARHLVCVVPEIENEGGEPSSAARSDGEPATAPPRREPSVRLLREAAGRPYSPEPGPEAA